MSRRHTALTGVDVSLLLAGLLLAGTAAVAADVTEAPLLIDGEFTLRTETYSNGGDPATRLYTDTGAQHYAELGLNLRQRRSAFESIRASVGLLANKSAYRDTEQGGQLERGQLTWTKGDAELPFRLKAGDFLGYTSQRTLQRSLKGAQIELQPMRDDGARRLSILAFAGASNTSYRHFSGDNRHVGFSVLSEGRDEQPTVIGNVVFNHQAADNTINDERDHWVASIGLEHRLDWRGQRVDIETELAHFNGEYDNGVAQVSDKTDQGFYLSLSGRDASDPKALRYSVKYERYGQDYQPEGATTAADRQTMELRLSKPIAEGLVLAARAQRFKTAADSANPSISDVFGLNLSGSTKIGERQFSTQIDAFVNDSADRNRTSDSRTNNLRVGLSTQLAERTSGRLDISLTDTDNRVTPSGTLTRSLNLGLNTQRDWEGWALSVAPSVGLIRVDASAGDNDQPSLGLNLIASKGPHNAQINLRSQRQDVHQAGGTDVSTQNVGLRYSFTRGPRSIGLEYDSQYRNPDPGLSSDGYRLALVYRQSFDAQTEATASGAESSTTALLRDPRSPFPTAPGQRLNPTLAAFRDAGYPQPIQAGSAWLFDHRRFEDLDARQRVAVVDRDGDVEQIGLILDLLPGQRVNELAELLADTLDAVSRQFGAPLEVIETGDYSNQLAADLQNGSFARLYQWEIDGQQIRLGIPPRLDGLVRIELVQQTRIESVSSRQSWGLLGVAE